MATDGEKLYYATETLKEHQDQIAELFRIHHACSKDVSVEIAALKVKAGIWGAIGGGIPVVLGLAIMLLKGYI